MKKSELDKKITEVSKSVLSYCLARTSNAQDAEDLAQEILLKIMTSAQNLRNDEAFYGFMWAVAGNVFKDWLRKKSRNKSVELNDIDATEDFDSEKISGDLVHSNFSDNFTNVFLDIAEGKTDGFSDNDLALIAEMVKKGYVLNNDEKLSVNAPVFTKKQYDELLAIFADVSEEIMNDSKALLADIEKIIKNHIPTQIKKHSGLLAYVRIFFDAISAPVGVLHRDGFIMKPDNTDILTTTFVIK